MKKLNRQSVMVLGAGVCLLIAGYSLFSGGEPPASVEGAAPPAAETPEETPNTAPASSLAPEVYQQIRAQLLQFRAEHTEPFVSEAATAGLVASSGAPAESPPKREWEPPKELTVPPVFVTPPDSLAGGVETNNTQRELAPDDNPQKVEAVAVSPPRLRGRIESRNDGQVAAILEWNGRLIRATNAPGAEWRIVKITSEALVVRYGEQTFTVEVPHAK